MSSGKAWGDPVCIHLIAYTTCSHAQSSVPMWGVHVGCVFCRMLGVFEFFGSTFRVRIWFSMSMPSDLGFPTYVCIYVLRSFVHSPCANCSKSTSVFHSRFTPTGAAVFQSRGDRGSGCGHIGYGINCYFFLVKGGGCALANCTGAA